jgi:hypothetical protein
MQEGDLKMKNRSLVLAAGALLALSSSAMAQFSAGSAGPFNSVGPAGDVGNGIFTFNYAGPSFNVGNITLTGTLTSGGTGTFATEARYRVTTPGGMIFNSAANAAGTTWVGDIAVNSTQNASALGMGGAGMWTFEFFESFNDAGIDAIWSNINFNVQAGIAPPPAFSGSFVGTPLSVTAGVPVNGSTIWTGSEVGLTDGAGEGANAYGPAVGFTEAGNEVGYRFEHGGGDLSGNLTGLSTDIDLIILDSTGLPINALTASANGGSTDENVLLAGAAPGTYYFVVDTFGATNNGSNFTLTVVPAPGAFALLGLGGLVATRRRR